MNEKDESEAVVVLETRVAEDDALVEGESDSVSCREAAWRAVKAARCELGSEEFAVVELAVADLVRLELLGFLGSDHVVFFVP